MAETWLQTLCEGCGATITFALRDVGTVQECPKCGGFCDLPEITHTSSVYDRQTDSYDQQTETTARQLAETERQIRIVDVHLEQTTQQLKHAAKQIEERDRLNAIEKELLDRAMDLMDRWEGLAVRIDKTLSQIEKQGSVKL